MSAKKVNHRMGTVTLRDAILARMKQLGLSPSELAESGLVSSDPTTVYRFLKGESDSKSNVVEEIMGVLEMTASYAVTKPEWVRNLRR